MLFALSIVRTRKLKSVSCTTQSGAVQSNSESHIAFGVSSCSASGERSPVRGVQTPALSVLFSISSRRLTTSVVGSCVVMLKATVVPTSTWLLLIASSFQSNKVGTFVSSVNHGKFVARRFVFPAPSVASALHLLTPEAIPWLFTAVARSSWWKRQT